MKQEDNIELIDLLEDLGDDADDILGYMDIDLEKEHQEVEDYLKHNDGLASGEML